MHNLYIPPQKIILFIILLFVTTTTANFLKDQNFAIPEFSIPTPSITLSLPAEEDKEVTKPEVAWSDIKIRTNGADRKYGNIIGMQTVLRHTDFVKEEWWKERIEELLSKGKTANLYDRKTIIVFPEHVGSGLVFLDEKSRFIESRNLKNALETKGEQVSLKKLYYEKSERMLDVYVRTFSELSKKYNVPILAGTIVLPNPKIVKGSIVLDKEGPLYNVSIPFSADGRVMDLLVKKTTLSKEEEETYNAGEKNQDRVWVVPGWKVAVFIGQEVFDASLYDALKTRPLDGMVSPAAVHSDMKWNGTALDDLTVWKNEGMPKYIKTTKALDLVQVFLMGNFFENQWKARTFNVRDFVNEDTADSSEFPTILNLYF
ncbi:hydrolase, carbon-nitrogen family protein [Leptospira sp. 96542]|nr:hydrolase, carbon-nitrogen family protein [Leptospira sp. 96542]